MAAPTTVVFANRKGGVGKTTSAANVAVCLTQAGARVLCLDLDSQGNLTTALGFDALLRPGCDLAAVLADPDTPPGQVIYAHPDIAGLALMPGTDALSHVETALQTAAGGERYVRTLVTELADAGYHYDWVIIDTPPGLGALTVAGMVAADRLICPGEAEPFSFRAAVKVRALVEQLRRHGSNDRLRFDGVLLTGVDERLNLTKDVRETIVATEMECLPVAIPRSVRVAEAVAVGAPICHTHPDHPSAQAYQQLTLLLMDGGSEPAITAAA